MGALVDVLHVCGREYGGVFRCTGLGLLQCGCCRDVASPFYFRGFMLVFVFHSILSLLYCLAFYYYVSILLVNCYPFYLLWVTGEYTLV